MKQTIIILSLIIGISTFGQQFEIPAEEYPFYTIIEWKGIGSMLLNRDPSGNSKKVNLTLVSDKTTRIWQQSFNPNGKDFYYISSENARYVYFLDNLNPENGKISLHQLNSAGNIKSSTILLGPAIKKLGAYDFTKLELMDIVTTDKALVHIFRYHDEKEKKYTEIATFMTHHNMLVYATIIGEVSEISLKEGNYGHWNYCGFTDDQIYFAAGDYQNKQKGWTVKNFTSKAVLTETRFIKNAGDKFEMFEKVGIGSNGKTILNPASEIESASLIYHVNQFYLIGILSEGTTKSIKLKQLKDGEWLEKNTVKIVLEPSKKTLQFGCFTVNEGIGFKLGSSMNFIPFDKSKKQTSTNFSPRFNTNPSRFMVEEKKEFFTVSLPGGNLFFDLNQLNKSGNVKFEYIKK
jgi:hypothetical protein